MIIMLVAFFLLAGKGLLLLQRRVLPLAICPGSCPADEEEGPLPATESDKFYCRNSSTCGIEVLSAAGMGGSGREQQQEAGSV